jgi:single-strand DNA-binding protein
MACASVQRRLGSDPVASKTRTGQTMFRATIVVDITPHSADEPETMWVWLPVFGAVAQALVHATKGKMATTQGRMTRGHYTGREGTLGESRALFADALLTALSAQPKGCRPGRLGSATCS